MIEFENVSFSYEGQEHGGLHGISLKIADGECVLFCGRSGCGKTTVTRLVNGLIPQFYQGELRGVCWWTDRKSATCPCIRSLQRWVCLSKSPDTVFQCGYGQ